MSEFPGQPSRMRLAELSQRAGIPRSTIKFYLREGLLPAGAAHAKNQASYGSQHVERLALIRALREVAELPLDAVAKVTAELDRGWKGDPIGEAMRAMHTLPSRGLLPGDAPELRRLTAEVREFMRALPWTSDDAEGHYFADEIAAALLLVRRHLYPDYAVADLASHAEIAWLLSEKEFERAPGPAGSADGAGRRRRRAHRRAILGGLPVQAHLRRAAPQREHCARCASRPAPRSRPRASRRPAEDEAPLASASSSASTPGSLSGATAARRPARTPAGAGPSPPRPARRAPPRKLGRERAPRGASARARPPSSRCPSRPRCCSRARGTRRRGCARRRPPPRPAPGRRRSGS